MQQKITQPWTLPLWKPNGEGNGLVLVYLIAVHVLAFCAVASLFFYGLPSMKVVLTTIAFIFYGSLSTTLGYHRALTHRAVKLHPWVEQFLIFGAVSNGSGSPETWVANHRNHHANSDTESDVSSPRHGGFWWAHLRWLYQCEPSDPKKWAKDIVDSPKYMNWTKWQPFLILASLTFGYFIGGFIGMLWIGAFRMVWCLHGQCSVNSLLHLKPGLPIGAQSARNILWIGPLLTTAWGENWHENHHQKQAAANFGRHWWQVDVAWHVVMFLWMIELAKDVRVYENGKLYTIH